MSGDSNNVTSWADADVYIGSLLSTNPEDGDAFVLSGGNPWVLTGLLDGSAGSEEAQTWDNAPYSAWGAGEIGSTKKNLAITRTFTAMEVDGKAGLALRYDTSGITFGEDGELAGDLAGRNLHSKFKFAIEVRSNGIIDRRISKGYAQVDTLGTVKYAEDAPSMLAVTLKIYPDMSTGKPVFWEVYKGAAS